MGGQGVWLVGWGGADVGGCRGNDVGWDWALGVIVGLGVEWVGEGEVGVGGMIGGWGRGGGRPGVVLGEWMWWWVTVAWAEG